MALGTIRLRLQRAATGADPIYFSWGVAGWEPTMVSSEALRDAALSGMTNGMAELGAANIADSEIDMVEIFPGEGGPAEFVELLAAPQAVGSAVASQHVLQCAVNELILTTRGPAVKGRMFVGPLAGVTGSVISNVLKDGCARLMQEVYEAFDLAGFQQVVISRYDEGVKRPAPIGFNVIGFRVDNRIDILKSRRVDPVPTGTTDYDPIFTV